MNVKRLLESVGYRILPDNKSMCKPYGFSMMKYNLETNTIAKHFYGRGTVTEILTWNSEVIDVTNRQTFLEAVAAFEEYNSGKHGRYVDFSFETSTQYWNNTL